MQNRKQNNIIIKKIFGSDQVHSDELAALFPSLYSKETLVELEKEGNIYFMIAICFC
jgi:hypothetical protein